MAKKSLKLRVFAGPNGSGKSTITDEIKETKIRNTLIDLGVYVNADVIQQSFSSDKEFVLNLSDYELSGTTQEEFHEIVVNSGLAEAFLPEEQFSDLYSVDNDVIRFNARTCETYGARLAQILADFLRQKLLIAKRKFSFETVFSHCSKLKIMEAAKQQGYKIYLYFVATEHPRINKYRVKARVQLAAMMYLQIKLTAAIKNPYS